MNHKTVWKGILLIRKQKYYIAGHSGKVTK